MTATRLSTLPAGKIRCFVTGKLRSDTPEEHVRQRMARSLVEEYGYDLADLHLEFRVVLGRARKRVDIAVFGSGQPHSIQNARIFVEAKPASVKPADRDQGFEQLHSYMAAAPNVSYGLWVGSEIRAFERVESNGKISFPDSLDIPFADGSLGDTASFESLVPATDSLKDTFKRCHNYIAANQGGSKESAFHEFLKITFCKVYDERHSEKPMFHVGGEERRSTRGQRTVLARIEGLFQDVCNEYGYIFGEEEEIKLSPMVVAYIVGELQKYSLLETEHDYKGQAYEEIVGSNSRGERGEFFTPRNLCSLAVDIALHILGTSKLNKVRVLDPACGTGGFLKTYIHRIGQVLLEREKGKTKSVEKAQARALESVRNTCDRNLFGVDFNPILVRAAQMNLVMHGDGSSNVFHGNSLLANGEWPIELRSAVRDSAFDLILTNPPFGEDLSIDDRHVLDQYSVSTFESSSFRQSLPPQCLFIERCHRLLKPGGLFVVVTPDNIVSNPSYRFMRHWILGAFELISSIALPSEMFQPWTGTRTSLLVLRKRVDGVLSMEELESHANSDFVFMSIPKRIGHDQRGNPIPLRNDAGDILHQEETRKILVRGAGGEISAHEIAVSVPLLDDELPRVFREFCDWYEESQQL
jgi:type I restriction enzyme M protein